MDINFMIPEFGLELVNELVLAKAITIPELQTDEETHQLYLELDEILESVMDFLYGEKVQKIVMKAVNSTRKIGDVWKRLKRILKANPLQPNGDSSLEAKAAAFLYLCYCDRLQEAMNIGWKRVPSDRSIIQAKFVEPVLKTWAEGYFETMKKIALQLSNEMEVKLNGSEGD